MFWQFPTFLAHIELLQTTEEQKNAQSVLPSSSHHVLSQNSQNTILNSESIKNSLTSSIPSMTSKSSQCVVQIQRNVSIFSPFNGLRTLPSSILNA